MNKLLAHITGSLYDLRPIIECRVAPHGSFKNDHSGGIKYHALIDTGCTDAIITQKVIDDFNLQPDEYGTTTTANGLTDSKVYYVDFVFEMPMQDGRIFNYKIEKAKGVGFPKYEYHDLGRVDKRL